ncbi:MAG: hypothetical protein MUF87_18575 [Anaerolineae bacterium]|jgi:hypothetical protein|nr:hypothetical protein [Anaerolineae bacterium]
MGAIIAVLRDLFVTWLITRLGCRFLAGCFVLLALAACLFAFTLYNAVVN